MPAEAKRKAADDAGSAAKAAKSSEIDAPTDCTGFRDYGTAEERTKWESVVEQHYWLMRTNHTMAFYARMKEKFGKHTNRQPSSDDHATTLHQTVS